MRGLAEYMGIFVHWGVSIKWCIGKKKQSQTVFIVSNNTLFFLDINVHHDVNKYKQIHFWKEIWNPFAHETPMLNIPAFAVLLWCKKIHSYLWYICSVESSNLVCLFFAFQFEYLYTFSHFFSC